MKSISGWYGNLLAVLAGAACVLLLLMMLLICGDVLLRNVAIWPGVHGISWSNEVSERMLFIMTMLAAPWLLRQGQHIRVDILLRALPRKTAWYCELLTDCGVMACCIIMVGYGVGATLAAYQSGALSIKTLITAEWWWLVPLPVTFSLLAIEVFFRIEHLYRGDRAARADAPAV